MSNIVICSLESDTTTLNAKGESKLNQNRSVSPVLDSGGGGVSGHYNNWIHSELRWIFITNLPDAWAVVLRGGMFPACVMNVWIFSTIRITNLVILMVDVFLWKLSSALVHFNASQRDSDWGTDPAEQDFDTVCEKFITASATQCPVPEVIYSLRAFDILQTAALWVGAFFPQMGMRLEFSACIIKGFGTEALWATSALHMCTKTW